MKHTLSCHCGAVTLAITLKEPLSTAARCDCLFCRRRAAATVAVDQDDLLITKGADNLTLYQWNTNTAEHYFCNICGIYTHHRRRIDSTEFGVNLGAIDGVTPEQLRQTGWNDGVNHPSDAKD